MAMLMMMEAPDAGGVTFPSDKAGPSASLESSSNEDDELIDSESEGGMTDWEDVYDYSARENKSQIPDGPVEITLAMPDGFRKKRKKKDFDWKLHLERRIRRFRKDVAIDMHKIHILCLVSLGMQQNQFLNDETLSGFVISMVPKKFQKPDKRINEERIVENLLSWYKKKFPLDFISHCSDIRLVKIATLVDVLSRNSITDARLWVLIFIAILRSLGMTVRMVLSFQPMPFKCSKEQDKSKDSKSNSRNKGVTTKKTSSSKKVNLKGESSRQNVNAKKTSDKDLTKTDLKRQSSNRKSSQKAAEKTKIDMENSEFESDSESYENEKKQKKNMKNKKSRLSKSFENLDSQKDSSEAEFDETSDTSAYFKSPSSLRGELKVGSNRKILSDEEKGSGVRMGRGHDFWLEVYFASKQRWICFDCFKCQFGKPFSLENSASQPISYVIGFRNDNSVKDLTQRYARQWATVTRKAKPDEEWWVETMMMFDKADFKENQLEDDEIKGQLLRQPIPSSISQLKSHPLYALKRHLLKFEAIYPDSAIPVGYVGTKNSKEPVYARDCVRTLHARSEWLKEGRLVRIGEEPYKMVKSRPKFGKPKENPDALDLEVFGEWQTEKYMAPPAVNGKVPRNEYGNVELFKPWMLPLGTVQVKGSNLKRIAKKLNIDVAEAMVGWDHHSGRSHPMMDGVVVCEEFADTLRAAAEEDAEIQRLREIEKLEKRVYGGWRRLIRGLMIKQRLTTKFLQDPDLISQDPKQDQSSISPNTEATDVLQSWPMRQQEEVSKKKVVRKQKRVDRNKKVVEKKAVIKEDLDEEDKSDDDYDDDDEQIDKNKETMVMLGQAIIVPTKKKHEIGQVFSQVREVVENLNISEDSDSDDEEEDGDHSGKKLVEASSSSSSSSSPSSLLDCNELKKCNKTEPKLKKLLKGSNKSIKKGKESIESDSSSSDEKDCKKNVKQSVKSKRLSHRVSKKVDYCERDDIEKKDD